MAGKQKDIVPQVGPGITGESHPSTLEGSPTDSGEGGNQPCNSTKQKSKENQKENQNQFNTNPFERRESLQRTPPRRRSSSLTDMEPHKHSNAPYFATLQSQEFSETFAQTTTNHNEEPTNKRKKPTESPEKQLETTKRNKTNIDTYQKVKTDIQKAVEKFGKILADMYKPKQEFKVICSKLELCVETLNEINPTKSIEAALAENKRLNCELTTLTDKYMRQEEEYLQVKGEIENLKAISHTSTNSNEIRCTECETARRNAKMKILYKQEETYSNFKRIEETDWESDMFKKIPTIDGHIWETTTEDTIIIPCNEGFESKEKTVSIALNKFGGRDGLKRQGKKKGEVAFMTQTLGFPNEEGEMIYQSRAIFYPLVTDTNGVEDEEDTFKSLQIVKGAALKSGCSNLVTVERTGPAGESWNRMLQYIFDGSEIQIKMHKIRETRNIPKKKPQNNQKRKVSLVSEEGYKSDTNSEQKNSINNEVNKSNKRVATRTKDALLVKMENKSYSEVLKIVRSSIDPEAIGVEVNSVGKTKKGDLLVTVKNGEHKTQNLKNEIQKIIPEAQISIMINKKILHLKGMEEDVTIEEIQKSVAKETESDSQLIEVRAIRPAFGGRKNATVILADKEANKLIQKGKLKIGWTFCKIMERKKDSRCLKCWEYGHQRDQCQGPNRDNLCRKCTQEGHKAAVCTGKLFCLFCGKEGHPSDTRRCQQKQNFQ